jgi:hypothetical protein
MYAIAVRRFLLTQNKHEEWSKLFYMYHTLRNSFTWEEYQADVFSQQALNPSDYSPPIIDLLKKYGMSPRAFYKWRNRAWEVSNDSRS